MRRSATGQRTDADPDRPRQSIASGVRSSGLDGDRIDVDAQDVSRPEARGRNREDPGAAADIEHAGPAQLTAFGGPLHGSQAEAGGRMKPRPERHPRIERDDDIARDSAMTPPCRLDHKARADAHDREVRLPGTRPVGFGDGPRPKITDRAQAECLEVRQRLLRGSDGPPDGGAIPGLDVRPHDGRPQWVDPGSQSLVDEVEARLHARAAGGQSAEDLADGLDGLEVGLDGEFQPGPGSRRAGRDRNGSRRRGTGSPAVSRARHERDRGCPRRRPRSPRLLRHTHGAPPAPPSTGGSGRRHRRSRAGRRGSRSA